jgi:glycosyltransferase involved in cell wall biosynthesis
VPETQRLPVVTVIMPVKDPHPGYLDEALESVRTQTVPWWRLVIVVELPDLVSLGRQLERWLADPRIRLVANEGSSYAGAFNTGMRAAETEFVALLLCDDLWHPDAVAVLEDHIARYPDADFFHSARRIIDDHGRPISSVYPARASVTLADFFERSPVKHLLCWRRSLALSIGGMDERTTCAPDDFDFPWTMAEHGAVFCPIAACLYIYRDHRCSPRKTTHVPRSVRVRDMRRVMRKHGMTRRQANRRIRKARRGYLRQALYRSRLQEQAWRWLGREPSVWRERYR